MADYKEVFMLFDKDQDGVLTTPELAQALRTLGYRLEGKGASYNKDNRLITHPI